jgi:hypothetical protein
MSKVAIVDGDVLCYHSCPPRWDADAPIELDADGHRIYPTFTPEQDRRYLEMAWGILRKNALEIKDKLYADECLIAVQGEGNFRKQMYPNYKINTGRQTRGKPPNVIVPVLRQLLVAEDLAIASDGFEADDFIRTWALQARAAGEDYVICSVDKDLLCIPGTHLRMVKDGEPYFQEVSEWEAEVFFYEQLLKGDPVDSIPGIPGIGPKKAEAWLKDCTTVEELQEQVVDYYIRFYQDEWFEYLLANGRLLYLSSYIGDYFDPTEWPVVKELR